jgi:hypothetical protein
LKFYPAGAHYTAEQIEIKINPTTIQPCHFPHLFPYFAAYSVLQTGILWYKFVMGEFMVRVRGTIPNGTWENKYVQTG